MGASPDHEPPEDLADRLESALRALWRGDGSQFEQLLDSEDSAGPRLSELYDGVLDRRAVPSVHRRYMHSWYQERALRSPGYVGWEHKSP